MDLAGREATEGREGPQSPARLGVTLRVRRNLILSPLILQTAIALLITV